MVWANYHIVYLNKQCVTSNGLFAVDSTEWQIYSINRYQIIHKSFYYMLFHSCIREIFSKRFKWRIAHTHTQPFGWNAILCWLILIEYEIFIYMFAFLTQNRAHLPLCSMFNHTLAFCIQVADACSSFHFYHHNLCAPCHSVCEFKRGKLFLKLIKLLAKMIIMWSIK